jgi:hypothetical protein
MIAADDRYGSAVLWDTNNGKRLGVFGGSKSSGRILDVSSDGRFLASCYGGHWWQGGRDDTTIRVWEIASGRQLVHFGFPFPNSVISVAFTPDARKLVTGMGDSTILIWNLIPPAAREAETQPGSFEKLWADLASEDTGKAYAALWTLVALPDRSIPFLQARLQPISAAEPQRLERLIVDLESERFAVRQKATEGLEQLRELAEPALRQALHHTAGLETRQRVEQLLKRLEGPITSPTQLQMVRAIQVLERIGSREARTVLKKIAAGTPIALETQEAKTASERLAKQANN